MPPYNELIPNLLFDLSLKPLFVVEHLVIAFNPNSPQCNASKKMPNLDPFAIFIRNPFLKNDLLLVEAIIVARSNLA